MLRRILSALRSAFRAMARFVMGALGLPERLFGAFLGVPDSYDLPEQAPPEDLDAAAPEISRQEYYVDAAADVLSWCAVSLIDDAPAPLPPGLPIDVSWWLPGLTRDEAEAILACDRRAISLHLQGISEIAGVRPVGPLTPAPWPAAPREEAADALVIDRAPRGSDEPARPSAPHASR